MKSIGINKEVIEYLTGPIYLLDAELKEFRIYKADYLVNIDIHLQLTRSNHEIRLTFIDVIEYAFYHNIQHYFYCVVAVPKFLQTEDGKFYLSLDPDEMIEGVSEKDNDMIMSKGLEGFIVDIV